MARADFVRFTAPWGADTLEDYAARLVFWRWIGATGGQLPVNEWLAMSQPERVEWVVRHRGLEWAQSNQDVFIPDPAEPIIATSKLRLDFRE